MLTATIMTMTDSTIIADATSAASTNACQKTFVTSQPHSRHQKQLKNAE